MSFFSLREFLEHKNVTFNKNGTISYEIHRHIKHVQQKTTGDVYKDTVYTTNVLLMGASTVAARHSKVAAYGFTVLAQGLNANPILNMTVHDLLWGYEDNMINLAAKFVPSILNEKKFGYLARVIQKKCCLF